MAISQLLQIDRTYCHLQLNDLNDQELPIVMEDSTAYQKASGKSKKKTSL